MHGAGSSSCLAKLITWDGARAPQDLRQQRLPIARRSGKHPRGLVADVIVGAWHLHNKQQTRSARYLALAEAGCLQTWQSYTVLDGLVYGHMLLSKPLQISRRSQPPQLHFSRCQKNCMPEEQGSTLRLASCSICACGASAESSGEMARTAAPCTVSLLPKSTKVTCAGVTHV